ERFGNANSAELAREHRMTSLTTPLTTRRIIVVLTVFAAAWSWWGLRPPPTPPEPPPLTITVYVSPDAWSDHDDRLANQAIDLFNTTHPLTVSGRPVEVTPESLASGKAERVLAGDESTASVWIPASTIWGELLDLDRPDRWIRPGAHEL